MKIIAMKVVAVLVPLFFLAACETSSSGPDAGTKCYDSDGRMDGTYTSPYECKRGGGTWK